MHTIILSAGQGRRLLPLTATTPKCLLHVGGKTVLQWQIDTLVSCGIERITVVVGFGAALVEAVVRGYRAIGLNIDTVENVRYTQTDNLVSCWVARRRMDSDFILLNGDTLFEEEVVHRLLMSPSAPVSVAVSRKDAYDADDMKVMCEGSVLLRVGKDLPPQHTDGESIGMSLFRGEGPAEFRKALKTALDEPQGVKRWYLSAINEMAKRGLVRIASVQGLQWAEIDYAHDLEKADDLVGGWQSRREAAVFSNGSAASPA